MLVWLLPIASWREHWPTLRALVAPSAWRRCAGVRDPVRRRDRLLANALHRQVVADALGWAPDRLPLYRAVGGQPRLALPGWHTSLSHADGIVAIALSDCGPVGVDVERRTTATLRPIADLVCTAAEWAAMQAADDIDQALLATWVRKEAALKAVGVGLAQPMASFAAAQDARLVLADAGGAPVPLQVRTIEGAEGCVLGVAGPPGRTPRWQWLNPQD